MKNVDGLLIRIVNQKAKKVKIMGTTLKAKNDLGAKMRMIQ